MTRRDAGKVNLVITLRALQRKQVDLIRSRPAQSSTECRTHLYKLRRQADCERSCFQITQLQNIIVRLKSTHKCLTVS